MKDPLEFDESRFMTPLAMAHKSDWRLLRRLHLPDCFNASGAGAPKRAIVVDVETTGLDLETDEVIQLALLSFDYEAATGRILSVQKKEAFEGLREPTLAIPEEVTILTGITAEMVAGKQIDGEVVRTLVSEADLVIAHNARFDRPMVEKLWPCFAEKPWACTLDGVDWLREGFGAGKLDYLGMQFGWFYDGHTALADCEACLALLVQTLPTSDTSVMATVLQAARAQQWLVCAVAAPFDQKDRLKKRGYRWRPDSFANGKVWWKIVSDQNAEMEWLGSEVYGRKPNLPVQPVTALTRYSERLWEF